MALFRLGTAASGSGLGVAVGAAKALTMTWKLPLAVWPAAAFRSFLAAVQLVD